MLSTILLAILIKIFYGLKDLHLTRKNIYPNNIKYLYKYEYDHIYDYVYDNIDTIIQNIQSKQNQNFEQIEWKEINNYIQNNAFNQSDIIIYVDSFINKYGNNFTRPDIDPDFIKPDIDQDIDPDINPDIDSNFIKPDIDYKIQIGEYLMGGMNFKRNNRWQIFKDNIDFFTESFDKYSADYDSTYRLFVQRKSILELLEDTCFLLEYNPIYRSVVRKIRIQLSQLLLLSFDWY
jgi:hypothetical protein